MTEMSRAGDAVAREVIEIQGKLSALLDQLSTDSTKNNRPR